MNVSQRVFVNSLINIINTFARFVYCCDWLVVVDLLLLVVVDDVTIAVAALCREPDSPFRYSPQFLGFSHW